MKESDCLVRHAHHHKRNLREVTDSDYARVGLGSVADLDAAHRSSWPRDDAEVRRHRSSGHSRSVVVLDEREIELSNETTHTESVLILTCTHTFQ